MRLPFRKIVTDDGSVRMVVECYILSTKKNNMENFQKVVESELSPEWVVLNISGDDDEMDFLLEAKHLSFSSFCRDAVDVLNWASESELVQFAVLMFCTGYEGREALLADSTADQIYGMAASGRGPVLTFDSAIMASEAWKSVVGEFKQAISWPNPTAP